MTRKDGHPWNRREFLQGVGATVATASMMPQVQAQGKLPVAGHSDWTRFGYDLHNTRFNSREATLNAGNVGRLRPKWRHEIPAPIQTSPTVVGDTLFTGAWDGHYHALDAETGEPKWKYDADIKPEPRWGLRTLKSTAEYNRGRIYFGTGTGDLACVDGASGKEIWKTNMGPGLFISSSPTIYGNRIFIGTSGGNAQIICVDAETGAIRWRFKIVPDRDGGGGSSWTASAIDEEQNIVYSTTGNPSSYNPPGPLLFTDSILANDLETGELLWYYQVRATDPFDLDFSCHPMLFEATHPERSAAHRRCVGAGSKTGFHAFDRDTGEHLWTTGVTNGGPTLNSTAYGDDKIYMVSNGAAGYETIARSATVGLHAWTGEILWWTPNASSSQGAAAYANGLFYQGFRDGTLQALDTETGEPLWSYQLPAPRRGGIVISNGTLYAICGGANSPPYAVYAFGL